MEIKKAKASITTLKPHPENPRLHSEIQIKEIGRSINMFKQYRPIIVDEDNIILAGHGLWLALKDSGAKSCDIIRYTGLSNKNKKKLLLADNKIQSMGHDNQETIKNLVLSIVDNNIPGYDEDILKLLSIQDQEDEKFVEENNKIFESTYVPEDADFFEEGSSKEEPGEEFSTGGITCPFCGGKFKPE